MFVKFIFSIIIVSFYSFEILANILYVPNDYSTIQEAIDNSFTGDTVLVSTGTYIENIDYKGKDIIVGSYYLQTGNEEIIFQTIIESDRGSVVTFKSGESNNAILCGFTITEGTGTVLSTPEGNRIFGGGIFISKSSPTIKNNYIVNNDMISGGNRGGGISIKDSANPLIYRNTITDNDIIGILTWVNYFGGGIWIDSKSNPIIGGSIHNSNNIYGNTADNGRQVFRNGWGNIINAQYNYWKKYPPSSPDIYPFNQFDISNWLDRPVGIFENQNIPIVNNYKLSQNYPNPFNPRTIISYRLSVQTEVDLSIYNILGQKASTLVSGKQSAGKHVVEWDASDFSSGVYFYRLSTKNGFSKTKKMVLMR
ncbi:MAG: T9SS type A sorting domain-containing protein [Caldithrix sp.]|nr:T9SS type A sorting domain-containing protein [Caldithrix sp.]